MTPSIGWFPFAVALSLSLIAMMGTAAGADTVEVESLIRQGVDLRQQGRDERALPLFQKAFALAPTPRTAGQLGLAEMATGYWFDAEQHLGRALESPDHPWVEKHRKVLQDALTDVRSHIGEILVDGSPPGASVTIDNKSVGTLPLPGPVRVVRGKVGVEVSAPGYVTITRSVSVGGARERVTVALEKTPAQVAAEAVPAPPVLSAAPPPAPSGPSAELAAAPAQGDGGRLRRQLGWGAGIGAVVALGFGVVETVVWQKQRSEFNDPVKGCFEDAPMRGAAGCSASLDSAQGAQTLAIVGYAVAGALGVTLNSVSSALQSPPNPHFPSTHASAPPPAQS